MNQDKSCFYQVRHRLCLKKIEFYKPFAHRETKGEAVIWGGECAGVSSSSGKPANLKFNGDCRSCFATHNCKMTVHETPDGPKYTNIGS